VRIGMMFRLAAAYVWKPWEGIATIRMLAAYRQAQESLRETPVTSDLRQEQVLLAARRAGADPEAVESAARVWMEERPLDLLRRAMRPGVVELLDMARRRGLRLGVLSDYPAEEKLTAMGILGMFDVVLCAQDAEVQRFKPSPLGLKVAMERLGVRKSECLYVGDRAEVDGTAAAEAGMAWVIVGGRRTRWDKGQVASLPELQNLLNASIGAR
jgi:putative hydrolase of the HAD superfamily